LKDGKYTHPRKAIEYLNKVVLLQPDYLMAYNARGVAYAYLGQYKNAQADYDEAIRLKPDYNTAYYNYACSFSLQKNAIQACNWLGLAIERGYKDWKHLEADKDFDGIRNEKCFVDILNKYARGFANK
jgi:Flp pilus assembly protein TadD